MSDYTPKAVCKMGTVCVCLQTGTLGPPRPASGGGWRCVCSCVLSEQNECLEGDTWVRRGVEGQGHLWGCRNGLISATRCAFAKGWGAAERYIFLSTLPRRWRDSLYFKARAALWEKGKSEDWNLRVLFRLQKVIEKRRARFVLFFCFKRKKKILPSFKGRRVGE